MDIKKLKDAHNALSAGRVAMSVLAAVTSAAFVGAFAYDRLNTMLGSTASIVVAIIVSIIWAFIFDAGIYKLTPFIFNSLANFKQATKSTRKSILLSCAILLLVGMSMSSIYTSLTAASVTVNMVTDKYEPIKAQEADNTQVAFLSSQLASVTKAFNDASKLYQRKRAGTNEKYVALKDRNALKVQMDKITKQYDTALRKYNRSQGEYDLAATQQNNIEQTSRSEQITVFATLYRYIGILSTVLFLFFSLCKELLEIEYPSVSAKDVEEYEQEDEEIQPIQTVKKIYEQAKTEMTPKQPRQVTVAQAKRPIGFATAQSEKKKSLDIKKIMGEARYNQQVERIASKTDLQLQNELRSRKSQLKNIAFTAHAYCTCRLIIDRLQETKDVSKHVADLDIIEEKNKQELTAN